jgi:hypothetical protein
MRLLVRCSIHVVEDDLLSLLCDDTAQCVYHYQQCVVVSIWIVRDWEKVLITSLLCLVFAVNTGLSICLGALKQLDSKRYTTLIRSL